MSMICDKITSDQNSSPNDSVNSPSYDNSDSKQKLLENQEDINTIFGDELEKMPFETRYTDFVEIYNEQMSPTQVFIANDVQKQKKVVVKKIVKKMLNENMSRQAQLEMKISMKVKHYNVVQSFDTYENDREYILVQELIEQADYFNQKLIQRKRPIKNNDKIRFYFYDILCGLVYLHESGILHLDIKPQNLFCQETNDTSDEKIKRVKLGDFGLSREVDENKKVHLHDVCGTYGYLAPEIQMNAQIDEKADIWALGITIYNMVCAYLPHHVKGYKYGDEEVPFRQIDWKKKPAELKALVQSMLNLDPKKRPTARECLQHPYFKHDNQSLRKRSSFQILDLAD